MTPYRKHKNLKGESIDNRPESINARKEPGHHEMDLVVGARGGKKALLVITERVTRYQHIVLIKDKTQRSVIRAINRLERKLGKETFSTLFKSITCDNGVEFQDFKGIEQSVYSKKKKRTKVYFAHPYSSFERGSNENANRLIRCFLPKGSTFDELSQRVVQRLARWMNKIPRKLFDGKSANEMVKALGLNFWGGKALRAHFFQRVLHLNLQFTLSPAVTTMRQVLPLDGKVLSSYVIIESLHTKIKFMLLFLQYAHGGVGRKTVFSYQALQRLKKWVSRM